MESLRLSVWIKHDLHEITAILETTSDAEAERLVAATLAAERVFVLGLGRSGLLLRRFAMRLTQIGLPAHVVGDVTTPAIGPGDLLVVVSGSGKTETVLSLAAKAHGFGARIAAITGNPDSPLARTTDLLVVMAGGSVKDDLSTPSRLPLADALEQAMIIYLDCIAAMVGARRGVTNADMMRRHANLE